MNRLENPYPTVLDQDLPEYGVYFQLTCTILEI